MKFKVISILIALVFLFSGLAFGQGFERSAIHHYIHAGNFFSYSWLNTQVSDTTSILLLIRTGDRMVHFHSALTAGGQVEFRLHNGASVSTNGTELGVVNHNRESDNEAKARVYKNPTGVSTNNTLLTELVPGGVDSKTAAGGVTSKGAEFVLKRNSLYVVNATNTSAQSIDINIRGSFYEMNLQ